jgi:tetratricopeptide (TPR) repeat protein
MLGRILLRFTRGSRGSAHGNGGEASSAQVIDRAARLIATGDPVQAERLLREGIERWPLSAPAHRLLGSLLGSRGRLAEAGIVLQRALSLEPEHAACLADLGNIHRLQGQLPQAQSCYTRSLAIDPANAAARFNLASLLHAAGDTARSLDLLMPLLASPAQAEAVRAAVRMLDDAGKAKEALALCERVLDEEPDNQAAHAGCGFLLLKRMLDPVAALHHFDRALSNGGRDAEVLANRAIALQDLGRVEDALAAYEDALTLDAGMDIARFHRALALLLLGRFQEAWPDYELRHLSEDRKAPPVDRPQWSGQDLAGKSLLVYGEQGIGDQIMFASCIPDVMRRCPNVVIACSPKLVRIFRRSFPAARCVPLSAEAAEASDVPATDLMTPIGSLPLRFRHTRSDFPDHSGYLRADPALVAGCVDRLRLLGSGAKVGISWRGGTVRSRQGLRTIPAPQLAALLENRNVHFVDLQYDSAGCEPAVAAAIAAGRLHHWPDVLADYDRTAAMVCALDLVVSVCTAVIHLAGALGKPVWIMAPHVPEWRYGLQGESMPWYPSARLFRQPTPGNWGSVTGRVSELLDHMLK